VTADEQARRATADGAAKLAAELVGKPLTAEQQRLADRATRVAQRLLKLEQSRKAGRR
jgi:hypothetical protein